MPAFSTTRPTDAARKPGPAPRPEAGPAPMHLANS